MLRVLGCDHRHAPVVYVRDRERCWRVHCINCGKRGPRKHSRPLALARFRSVGTVFRAPGCTVRYTGTAARDDASFARPRPAQPCNRTRT